MQRPAAQAVVKANQALEKKGYGLWVFDSYRPWRVTKMFWEATPGPLRTFVADPSKGSRHNRGCAVDLTLYDLKTGKPVEMVSGYDEFSDRAYPNYWGGTSRQRWHRNCCGTRWRTRVSACTRRSGGTSTTGLAAPIRNVGFEELKELTQAQDAKEDKE